MTDLAQRLLSYLESRANARGLAMAREAVLQERLHCSRANLERALLELERTGKGRILSPLPFIAFRLITWPNQRENAAKTGPSLYSFKSSLSQSRLIKESYRDSDENESLLQEILSTLGEEDPTTFRGAIDAYSPEAIREALERVRTMKRIRKSRTALFRFLLPRIAKEPKSAA